MNNFLGSATGSKFLKRGFLVVLAAAWVCVPFLFDRNMVDAQVGANTGLVAALTGEPIASVTPRGFAAYHSSGTNRRLDVSVSSVNVATGTMLDVKVNGSQTGRIQINAMKNGFLRLDTAMGQTVPTIASGDSIDVMNGSATVLSGTFNTPPTPSPTASQSPTPTRTPWPSPSTTPTRTPCPSPTATPTGTGTNVPNPCAPPRPNNFFLTRMKGANVVPPVETMARGMAFVRVNAAGTEARIAAGFFGLSSAQTGASVNGPAIAGENGPVVFDLGTVGGTAGFVQGTFAITAAQLADLRMGKMYVVIKSADHADGEIRGQLRGRHATGDFQGSGLAEYSLFRPGTATWYHMNGGDWAFRSTVFGWPGDKPVSGDYDGDGTGDAAVFRNSGGLGVWRIRQSSNGQIVQTQWGLASDTPVTGDFDGDDRNDLAVYRQTTGEWFVLRSSDGTYTITRFGLNGDSALAADFDGDDRDDIVIFRPSTGIWYALRSSDGGVQAAQFGTTGDVPVEGDFDGDGRADYAVYRPSTGVWYSHKSTDGGYFAGQFGLNGDIPVPANYDGDTRTDFAVFRPSAGRWYVLRTSDGGVNTLQFGMNGDIPNLK